MRILIALGLAATTAGCMAIPPAPEGPQVISYETQNCFGACPVYEVTVSSDGVGTFEGKEHVSALGIHHFTVTRGQFDAFAATLAPWRPDGDRSLVDGACNGRIATDLDGVVVRWTDSGGSDRLSAYYGCDMEGNAAMFEALRAAPRHLPIGAMIAGR
ncbi:DUF6438 domain-containing protein [Sphingomicrobium nitratireducens]|uniref:DUF6438 domain-containing protein n=1 Tax=Sphingomicrobium nitratireducens TaxID=2964666 RepID=UPI00223FFE05|nr:DUF6438 domain-containing protein [Sphingomicrobium nitratireducens]